MKWKYKPSRFMAKTSYYDKEKADRAVNFMCCLTHTIGQWDGVPFSLMPWQEQIVRDVFGIVDKKTGYRQFRQAFIEIAKKNGKTEMDAAFALYLLCADGEASAEVYGCAADRDQASICFDVAKRMVENNQVLSKVIKVQETKRQMDYLPNGSKYRVLSAEAYTKHGFNVHGLLFDELHTQPNRMLFDTMTKGTGDARRQPLFFYTTTAGTNQHTVCFEQHQKALDIIEGRKVDKTFYPCLFYAAEEDDWTSEKTWRKANPSLGVTIDIERVREACESAKQNPAEENAFRQLRLNQWVKQVVRWMPMAEYDKGKAPIDLQSLKGRICYGGLDLSSTNDITAFVLCFPPEDPEGDYIVLPWFWLPEDNIDMRVKRDHVPYDVWRKEGKFEVTEGNVLHYGFIEERIRQIGEVYNIKEIAYDRWGSPQMVQVLEGMGFTVIPFGQGFRDMSPPTKELMKLVLEGRFRHGGNEVLRWMFDNVSVRMDPAGNIKMDKEKSTEKIDGAVAAVMALDRAIRGGCDDSESVYDERGVLFI